MLFHGWPLSEIHEQFDQRRNLVVLAATYNIQWHCETRLPTITCASDNSMSEAKGVKVRL